MREDSHLQTHCGRDRRFVFGQPIREHFKLEPLLPYTNKLVGPLPLIAFQEGRGCPPERVQPRPLLYKVHDANRVGY